MPIYMDRHDVSVTITAEDVAQLHQEDLKVQDQFGCQGLTYWFDGKRNNAFCLIEAPDVKSLCEMHNYAHGQVPHEVIEVDPSIVESFLGRIGDPEKSQNTELNIINDPAFRTIMLVSVKQINATIDQPLNREISALVDRYEGSIVKHTEYELMASFKSVSNAVDAASAIRSNLENACFKIALSAGIPVTEKKSIFEDTIKLAERMCRVVKGDIIVSREVRDLYNSENAQKLHQGITALSRADEQFLSGLMAYTEARWRDTNLKVEDLGQPAGCSKSQLYRRMLSLTGITPNTFINDYRLDEALTLLIKKDSNVSEIAFETGFSSPSYFSKCFQKKYGHSPSDLLAKFG